MRNLLLVLLFLLIFPVLAQDETQSPYEIALQRIQEAEESGATFLDLGVLGLTELPPEMFSISNLQMLVLSNNQLSSLPPEIGNLSNLQSLVLFSNQLSSLPAEIGQLENLQSLLLFSNQLSNLPPEIGQLENLQAITLGTNQLSKVPDQVFNLSNLQVLDLSNNQLSNLPPEIGNLKNLCYLNLSDNFELRSLPSEIGQLTRLTDETGCIVGNGLELDKMYSLISPPPEVVEAGTASVLEYLRSEGDAWRQLQQMIVGGLSSIGVVVAVTIGLRWRNRRGKKKNV